MNSYFLQSCRAKSLRPRGHETMLQTSLHLKQVEPCYWKTLARDGSEGDIWGLSVNRPEPTWLFRVLQRSSTSEEQDVPPVSLAYSTACHHQRGSWVIIAMVMWQPRANHGIINARVNRRVTITKKTVSCQVACGRQRQLMTRHHHENKCGVGTAGTC